MSVWACMRALMCVFVYVCMYEFVYVDSVWDQLVHLSSLTFALRKAYIEQQAKPCWRTWQAEPCQSRQGLARKHPDCRQSIARRKNRSQARAVAGRALQIAGRALHSSALQSLAHSASSRQIFTRLAMSCKSSFAALALLVTADAFPTHEGARARSISAMAQATWRSTMASFSCSFFGI